MVSHNTPRTWAEFGERDLLAKRQTRVLAYFANSASTRKMALDRLRVDAESAALCGVSAAAPPRTTHLSISVTAPSERLADSLAQTVADEVKAYEASLSPALSRVRGPIMTISDVVTTDRVAATSRPKWMMPALGAVALPFLGYFGFVFRDAARPTIGRAADLEDMLPFPLLGSIPTFSSVPKKGTTEESSHQPQKNALTRASLLAREFRNGRVIAITAVNAPNDYRTALSLGESLADLGRRVVVVDADMRSPSMSSDSRVGMAVLLLHGGDPAEHLVATTHPSLEILPTGQFESSTRLLLDNGPALVFSQLRRRADYIFVHTPPALSGPDASILADLSDEVILIARSATGVHELVDAGRGFREGSIRGLLMAD